MVSLAVTCFSCNENRAREATRGERPVTVATPAGESAREPRPAEGAATFSRAAWQTPEKAGPPGVSPPPATLGKGKFNSAQACGSCHQAIFAKWSHSMHSNSYLDPVFRDALYKAHYLSQGKAAPTCLRCHSPTVSETKDYYGTAEITREGVTCDYCHSIGALSTDTSGATKYQIDW
ncbi:MAG TPA: multiheme c-type cytochrome, partial [Myxococcales bacterium]|nr:multiheme c-type cytochrome [Myxococcales bacterium]